MIARSCLKQRHAELGFPKTVLSGKVVYIDNLVTIGPSRPVMVARAIEHAKQRQTQRKTSKQRAVSEAKKQMTAMCTIVGGVRVDSPEDSANAEEETAAEITEEQKREKLLTVCK